MLVEERETRFKDVGHDEILQWVVEIGVKDDTVASVAAQKLFERYPCRYGNCTKVLKGLLQRAEELKICKSHPLPCARIASIAIRGVLFKASEAKLPPDNANTTDLFKETLERAEMNHFLPAEHRLVLFCCRRLSEHSAQLKKTSAQIAELYALLLKECQRNIEEARAHFLPYSKDDTATLFNLTSTSPSLELHLCQIISDWAGLPITYDFRKLEDFSSLRINRGSAEAGGVLVNQVGELCLADPWHVYDHTQLFRDLDIASELDPESS